MQALKLIKPIIARLVLAFTVLALYVYAGIAIAQPAPPSGLDEMFRFACANEQALFQARTAFIEAKLELKPEQKPAFADFVAESRAAIQPLRDLCKAGPPPRAGRTIDRLKAMQGFEHAMVETHQGLIAAVEKLSPALTDEQDKALGEAVLPHGPMGGFRPPRPLP